MFPRRYFPGRYFAPRYWPPVIAATPVAPPIIVLGLALAFPEVESLPMSAAHDLDVLLSRYDVTELELKHLENIRLQIELDRPPDVELTSTDVIVIDLEG